MHDATCGDCGKQCQVPFEPRQDKPVYCRSVFQIINQLLEEVQVAADLAEEVEAMVEEAALAEEAALTEDHEKCTRLHVEIVAKIVRFHSSQDKTSQSIAASVFKVIKETRK